MSRLQCRGSIAGAAVVVALLSSRPADAQVGVDPGPPREPGGLLNALVTGVHYDVVNQALAERRLQNLQAKLRRDAERGDMAAVDCDVCRIDNVKYRIAIDEWLIRWNSRQYPDFYPIRTDAVSRAAIAQATHPTPAPYPRQFVPTPRPMAAASTISITIVNAEPAGPASPSPSMASPIRPPPARAGPGRGPRLDTSPTTVADRSASAGIGSRRVSTSSDRPPRAGRYTSLRACPESMINICKNNSVCISMSRR